MGTRVGSPEARSQTSRVRFAAAPGVEAEVAADVGLAQSSSGSGCLSHRTHQRAPCPQLHPQGHGSLDGRVPVLGQGVRDSCPDARCLGRAASGAPVAAPAGPAPEHKPAAVAAAPPSGAQRWGPPRPPVLGTAVGEPFGRLGPAEAMPFKATTSNDSFAAYFETNTSAPGSSCNSGSILLIVT